MKVRIITLLVLMSMVLMLGGMAFSQTQTNAAPTTIVGIWNWPNDKTVQFFDTGMCVWYRNKDFTYEDYLNNPKSLLGNFNFEKKNFGTWSTNDNKNYTIVWDSAHWQDFLT